MNSKRYIKESMMEKYLEKLSVIQSFKYLSTFVKVACKLLVSIQSRNVSNYECIQTRTYPESISKSGQWSRVTAIERDLEYVVPRPRLATRTQGISVKRRPARAAIHSAVIAWITRPEIFPTRAARHVARTLPSTPTREAQEANFRSRSSRGVNRNHVHVLFFFPPPDRIDSNPLKNRFLD